MIKFDRIFFGLPFFAVLLIFFFLLPIFWSLLLVYVFLPSPFGAFLASSFQFLLCQFSSFSLFQAEISFSVSLEAEILIVPFSSSSLRSFSSILLVPSIFFLGSFQVLSSP